MASFNKVIMIGHLTADPELKQTTSGLSVCNFSIAVNRRQSKEQTQSVADFFNVVAWRATAEFVTRYFKKGSPILVCGQLQTRTWTDNQNQKRYATDIVADEVSFVAPASQNNSASASAPAHNNSGYTPDAYGTPSFNNAQSANFEEIPNDDSLPF